jgi:hypothetical protein
MGLAGTVVHTNALIDRKTPLPVDYSNRAWRVAYLEALFENDRQKIGSRIVNAIELMLQRERELLANGGDFGELQALNRGLHALHALWGCLGLQATV